MAKERKVSDIITAIVFIVSLIVIVGVAFIVINEQKEVTKEFREYCNNEYGKGNWETVPADRSNMSFRNKYYIGEIWECVEK